MERDTKNKPVTPSEHASSKFDDLGIADVPNDLGVLSLTAEPEGRRDHDDEMGLVGRPKDGPKPQHRHSDYGV